MIYPLRKVMFHSYVELPEGKLVYNFKNWYCNDKYPNLFKFIVDGVFRAT
jgi:hypothetical protein